MPRRQVTKRKRRKTSTKSPAMPPPGFTRLTIDQQIDYVQDLWDHIAPDVEQVPLTAAQRRLLDDRLAAHKAAPNDGRPWREVFEDLQRRLRQPR